MNLDPITRGKNATLESLSKWDFFGGIFKDCVHSTLKNYRMLFIFFFLSKSTSLTNWFPKVLTSLYYVLVFMADDNDMTNYQGMVSTVRLHSFLPLKVNDQWNALLQSVLHTFKFLLLSRFARKKQNERRRRSQEVALSFLLPSFS